MVHMIMYSNNKYSRTKLNQSDAGAWTQYIIIPNMYCIKSRWLSKVNILSIERFQFDVRLRGERETSYSFLSFVRSIICHSFQLCNKSPSTCSLLCNMNLSSHACYTFFCSTMLSMSQKVRIVYKWRKKRRKRERERKKLNMHCIQGFVWWR